MIYTINPITLLQKLQFQNLVLFLYPSDILTDQHHIHHKYTV